MTDKNKQENILRSEENATKKIAERYNVPYVDLSSFVLNRELVKSFPVDFLYRLSFIPLEDNGETVKIAIADPSDIATIDSIEAFLGREIEVYAASERTIHEALRKSEATLQVLKNASEGFIQEVVE